MLQKATTGCNSCLTRLSSPDAPPRATKAERKKGRRATRRTSAVGIAQQLLDLPPPSSQTLIAAAGALGTAGLAAALFFGAKQAPELPSAQTTAPGMTANEVDKPERENAVLVFGSGGKLGRALVKQLVQEKRSVVAASRNADSTAEKLHELNLEPGQHQGRSRLDLEGNVDITNKASLSREELWRGVSQVAIAVGPLFGRQDGGQMGYTENMTSERVDAEGVSNIVAAAKEMLPRQEGQHMEVVLPIKGEEEVGKWERIDDVIMGGASSSDLKATASGAIWSGKLVIEGGGFCGTRIKGLDLDLSAFDGLALRVKGDAQMYKINLKTADGGDDPESTYAATFETTGDWQTIQIPFKEFVPVVRAKYNPDAPPLNPAAVKQIGFRLSRFDFNNLANPKYRPGQFQLELEGGIQGYKATQPAVVLVSSAAVERNAAIGDDAEARKQDIPILQLNPGGILNYKYMGETSLRTSGLPYTIVRPVGLTTEQLEDHFLLEASQGDRISGKISRAEAASVVVSALQTPAAVGKTIEVRRSEAASEKGRPSSSAQLEQLFLAAVEDWHRPRRALPPLPLAVPPPPPPSEDRVKEILADPRVQAASQRSQQQRENGSSQNGSNGNQSTGNGSLKAKEEQKELVS